MSAEAPSRVGGGLVLGAALLLVAACGAAEGGGAPDHDAGGAASACALPPSCAAGAECLERAKPSGALHASFRMSELVFTHPAALTTPLVRKIVTEGVRPSLPACSVIGKEILNWLVELGLAKATLRTGMAKPVADATGQGYWYVDEALLAGETTFYVHPVTFQGIDLDAAGQFDTGGGPGLDMVVPVYLDASAQQVIVVPIHGLRFVGRLSPSGSCIGRFDPDTLDPALGCSAANDQTIFVTGATVRAYVLLEEADGVPVQILGQSLCVLLSGDGDDGKPRRCRREGGEIAVRGDWCAAANAPATEDCADALMMEAQFAASAVKVNE